jgi:HK97 family phage major capsid protein
MKKSDQFKLERTTKMEAQRTIVSLAKTEKREMTTEENTSFDSLQDDIDALDANVTRAEKFEANELRLASNPVHRIAGEGDGEEKEKNKIAERFSIVRAINGAHPNGKLTGVEKEVHEMGLAENRAAGVKLDTDTGFSLPVSMLSRASQQTVGQDAGGFGGALVQNGAPVIMDSFRPRLFLEDLGATFLTNLQGGDVPLVVGSDFTMEFLAEGAALTPQKKPFGGPSLTPKRAGGAVDISNRLLLQSSVDVETMISNGLRNGFAQLLESAAINGAGGVAPTGLLSYAGVLASTITTSTAPTRALILELQALIEAADASGVSLGYLMSPKLLAALKQVKTDAGSGIFVYQDKMLDGIKAVATSLMPALNAGVNHPLIYGDFSQMVIGQWGAINIKVNPYSADLSDSVRLTLNTHADMQIANPKAFAKNAFLTA